MVHYRRNRVPGASYFFTVALEDRSSRLLVDSIDCFRRAYATMLYQYPVRTIAIAILPDHLHAIWKLPEADADYSARWRALKSMFVRDLRKSGLEIPINGKGEAAVWQRRFWEHTIRDDNDLRTHIGYVHWNPVKHGHARRVRDWPYSSFHRYVRNGEIANDWGGGSIDQRGTSGE